MHTVDDARALGMRWQKANPAGMEGVEYWHPPSGHRVRLERPFGWVGPLIVMDGYIPDFRFGATRGAALAVVRERWRCDSLSLLYNGAYGTDSWIIVGSWPTCIPIAKNAPTEAEALVIAVEAAP